MQNPILDEIIKLVDKMNDEQKETFIQISKQSLQFEESSLIVQE